MAIADKQAIYRFGGFVLDSGNEALQTAEGVAIPLRPKSLELLRLMVENAGRVVGRAMIMEALWPNIFVTDDNITQCILDIRRALGHEARDLLRTLPRRGYIFEAGAVRRSPVFSTPTGAVAAFRSRLSVLVLPLKSLNGSDPQARLAESITADIVTDLAGCLNNLAPSEAEILLNSGWIADRQPPPPDYQADYVLRGNVKSLRGTIVSLQLIHAATGVCTWVEQCELHGQRDRITRLVGAISIALMRDVGRRLEADPPPNLTAHELLLWGQAWLLRPLSPVNRAQAFRCFERAIAMEPDSVGSRLGIATVLVGNLANGWSDAIQQDEARAEALLLEVLQAGTDTAVAHAVYGTLRRLQGNLEASRIELEMAIDLAPRYAMAASQLGMTLIFFGQPEKALPHLERSVRVNPHDPQLPLLLSNIGMCRLLLGDVAAAIDKLRESEVGNPHQFGVPLLLAAALGLNSASAEAGRSLRRAVGLCPALGTLSGLRNWVGKQAGPDFMPLYTHMVERGLQRAGIPQT
jgi:DNA-binding winged helix-turn-helix (wHTH) protein/tetratricopeptide (TPR) repeat protein